MKQPKYKKELRKEIIQNVNSIKSVFTLREIYKLTEIMNRKYDDKQWETVTDHEWNQTIAVSNILRCDDPKQMRIIKLFSGAITTPEKRRSVHE